MCRGLPCGPGRYCRRVAASAGLRLQAGDGAHALSPSRPIHINLLQVTLVEETLDYGRLADADQGQFTKVYKHDFKQKMHVAEFNQGFILLGNSIDQSWMFR